MTIDWTQPVIDARDMDADPLFDSQGRVQACRVGSVVYALPAFEKLGLRNVPPPKPEPVLHEAWLHLYEDGCAVMYLSEPATASRLGTLIECRRISWMSDGSPVPGEASRAEDTDGYSSEATALEIEAARDAWRTRCKQWAAKASAWAIEKDALRASLEEARCQRDGASVAVETWKAKAEALQSEVEHREKMELNALRQRDAMKPVVDAAVAWADRVDETAHPEFLAPKGRRLYDAVRTSQRTPKKTAAEAVANVAEMMGPVKNCTTCAYRGLIEQYARCARCIDTDFVNWEPRHD